LGELGGGKTQFAKGLAAGLGISDDIVSPTFTYEKIYRGKNLTLYHFDLYREKTLDLDIKALILEAQEDKNGVIAIEWADRMKDFIIKGAKYFNFKWEDENEREIIER
jgi:tRNA threonylcarbamoyladenosine biosynthesis protein TsaE